MQFFVVATIPIGSHFQFTLKSRTENEVEIVAHSLIIIISLSNRSHCDVTCIESNNANGVTHKTMIRILSIENVQCMRRNILTANEYPRRLLLMSSSRSPQSGLTSSNV